MLLKVGSKGDDVKKLQTKLGTTPDGDFGPGTEKLVKEFQTKHGLTSDGIVGDGTWNKMFGSIIKEDVVLPSGGSLKLDKLKGHIPDSIIIQIPDVVSKFGINSNLRLAHFLSQCSHESGGFKVFQENLNYSAKGLKDTFKKYFISETAAAPYAKNPEKIASKVYGGRMGNGGEITKEGYKFRGRGALQTTGKENYKKLGDFLGVDLIGNPDLVATKYQLASAAFFFESNKLWSICDKGATTDVVTQLTKRINGGTIGLDQRIKEFNEFYKLLS